MHDRWTVDRPGVCLSCIVRSAPFNVRQRQIARDAEGPVAYRDNLLWLETDNCISVRMWKVARIVRRRRNCRFVCRVDCKIKSRFSWIVTTIVDHAAQARDSDIDFWRLAVWTTPERDAPWSVQNQSARQGSGPQQAIAETIPTRTTTAVPETLFNTLFHPFIYPRRSRVIFEQINTEHALLRRHAPGMGAITLDRLLSNGSDSSPSNPNGLALPFVESPQKNPAPLPHPIAGH